MISGPYHLLRLALPLAMLGLGFGCLGVNAKAVSAPPKPPAAGDTLAGAASAAAQSGVLNAAVQGVTGLHVQSQLPWAAVCMCAALSFMDRLSLFWERWLSHRREIARIRTGDSSP